MCRVKVEGVKIRPHKGELSMSLTLVKLIPTSFTWHKKCVQNIYFMILEVACV